MRKNKKPVIKNVELTTEPGPLVIKNLSKHSQSGSFEEAKTEWELVEGITSEDPKFTENCELCNSRLHKENWIIQNSNTGIFLRIGCDCIKRFIQFAGTSTQADSNTFFENKRKELNLESELQILYKEVIQLPLPPIKQANKFKKILLEFLAIRGKQNLINTPDGRKEIIENILKISFIKSQDNNKLLDLINGSLPVERNKKKLKTEKIKEGTTLNKKGRKATAITLSSSESYKNPADKYN